MQKEASTKVAHHFCKPGRDAGDISAEFQEQVRCNTKDMVREGTTTVWHEGNGGSGGK